MYGASALINYQVNGEWKMKNPKLIPYQKYFMELTERFDEINFFHLS